MKKVTIKAAVTYTEEGARSEAVFAGTSESAGYLAGWSGDYLAVRVSGEKQRFPKLKDAKNFLATQEIQAAPVMEGRKFIARAEGKKLTKAQMKKYGIL